MFATSSADSSRVYASSCDGGAVAIITQGPTPLEHLASVRLSGDVGDELEALVHALGAA